MFTEQDETMGGKVDVQNLDVGFTFMRPANGALTCALAAFVINTMAALAVVPIFNFFDFEAFPAVGDAEAAETTETAGELAGSEAMSAVSAGSMSLTCLVDDINGLGSGDGQEGGC